jgi:hypothetical protein
MFQLLSCQVHNFATFIHLLKSHLADWYDIEPLEYMDPFLQVVRSPETSGVVTDVALASVLKMLNAGLLGERYCHKVCLECYRQIMTL